MHVRVHINEINKSYQPYLPGPATQCRVSIKVFDSHVRRENSQLNTDHYWVTLDSPRSQSYLNGGS